MCTHYMHIMRDRGTESYLYLPGVSLYTSILLILSTASELRLLKDSSLPVEKIETSKREHKMCMQQRRLAKEKERDMQWRRVAKEEYITGEGS